MLIDDTFQFSNSRGFVVIEGVNGAGKSTLLSHLERVLVESQIPTLITRQPGGTALGKLLRSVLLESEGAARTPLAELFLFAADRAQHVSEVILPALRAGKLVLCDRYSFSTEAFQGYGRELDLDGVRQVNEIAVQGCYPDVVILLDMDPAAGLKRNASEPREHDSFEDEELSFHTRLRRGFLQMAEDLPIPFLVIDATQTREKVAQQATAVVQKLLKESKHLVL